MRSISIRRPSAATVIASTALFVALGGTSYAAVTIDGSSIKSKSITSKQVRGNTLTGKQIKESTLALVPRSTVAKRADAATTAQRALTADKAGTADKATTAEKAVTADKATTAATATNAQQLNGRDHTKFLANQTRIVKADSPSVVGNAGGVAAGATASCSADERAISGGAAWIIPLTGATSALDLNITATLPVETVAGSGEITGWEVAGRSFTATSRILRAYVVCVPKTA